MKSVAKIQDSCFRSWSNETCTCATLKLVTNDDACDDAGDGAAGVRFELLAEEAVAVCAGHRNQC
ncbi:hypothetical protein E4U13_005190 [Claviceps humidiphila]|uniref:Uncharacterized protein n=1 Tax=Claviceps humidiphila TaxID=1294629 RepID=A0A9P7PWK3_9HYPO|nr:hypothetical protein E4U13_005190 [Claviceps humidiphila]